MSVNISNYIVHKPFLLMIVALFVLLTSCVEKIVFPNMEDIETATMQEYRNDTPVSREISLQLDKESFFFLMITSGRNYAKISKQSVSDVPTAEKSFCIRLQFVSGEVRTLFIYEEEGKEYIEEPYLGIYQYVSYNREGIYTYLTKEVSIRQGGIYIRQSDYTYLFMTLNDAFGNICTQYDNNRITFEQFYFNIPMLPEYNGNSKAISINFVKSENKERKKPHPLRNHTNWIPKTRDAERAEDVRYIVIFEEYEKYAGYWYDRDTKKRDSDFYESTYSVEIYDLVKRKNERLVSHRYYDSFNIYNYVGPILEKYFSEAE